MSGAAGEMTAVQQSVETLPPGHSVFGRKLRARVIALTTALIIVAGAPVSAETLPAATNYSPPVFINGTIAFIATPAHDLKNDVVTAIVRIRPLDIRYLDAAAFGDWEYAALTQSPPSQH